ncbi:hypothetical protein J6590_005451 [Homalodisca vitripennis]|nr:hypothetical protein J6590_005451 [Homalodisca vitripennis]
MQFFRYCVIIACMVNVSSVEKTQCTSDHEWKWMQDISPKNQRSVSAFLIQAPLRTRHNCSSTMRYYLGACRKVEPRLELSINKTQPLGMSSSDALK